jgi:O-antigen/teichoic acid export membrane protein
VLGLWYIVRAVDTTTGQLYSAIGKPKYNTALAVVNLAVLAITVVPFILWWGPVGAAWALLAARVVCLVCNTLICRRVLRCSMRRLVGIVVPALKAGSAMAAALCLAQVAVIRWVVRYRPGWIDSAFEWVILGALVVFGAAVYAAALCAFERELFREVLGLVRDALPARWGSGDASDA